jgi:hypothetical protein
MKFLTFLFLIFFIPFISFSQNINNGKTLLIREINSEKISIFTYRYIDSLHFVNRKTFSLLDIFSKPNPNGSKNYELDISVPFRLVKTLLANMGNIIAQNGFDNFISSLNPDMQIITSDDITSTELNLLGVNKYGVVLPSSFRLITIKLPLHLFEIESNEKKQLNIIQKEESRTY